MVLSSVAFGFNSLGVLEEVSDSRSLEFMALTKLSKNNLSRSGTIDVKNKNKFILNDYFIKINYLPATSSPFII